MYELTENDIMDIETAIEVAQFESVLPEADGGEYWDNLKQLLDKLHIKYDKNGHVILTRNCVW